jgi:hypothetical protein
MRFYASYFTSHLLHSRVDDAVSNRVPRCHSILLEGCDDSTPVRGASYEPVAPLRA